MKLSWLWFFVLVALMSTQLGRHFWGDWSLVWGLRIDYLSWVLYLSDILALGLLGFWAWERRRLEIRKVKVRKRDLFLIGLVVVVNVGLALRPEVAVYRALLWAVVAGVGVYVFYEKVDMWLGWGLVVGISFNLLLAWLQLLAGKSMGGGWWWLGERSFSLSTAGIAKWDFLGKVWLRPYGTFSHPNALGGFALVAAAIILSLDLNVWVKRWGVAAAVILVGLSFSQSAWAGLLLLVVGKWWLSKRWQFPYGLKKMLLVVVFGALSLVGTVAVFFFSFPYDFWTRRQMLAEAAVTIFSQSPVVGVGVGNFLAALAPVIRKNEMTYFLQPVHNGWLLILSEVGVVGLGCVFWFLGRLVVGSVRWGSGEWLLILLITVWLLTWDHYVLTLQQNQLLFGVTLGLAAREWDTERKDD